MTGAWSKILISSQCPQKRRENEALCRSLHIDESPSLNETTRALCAPCDDCWTICHRSGRCFDMKSHRDTTTIGKDEYGRPVKKYYDCRQGQCSEISNLKVKYVVNVGLNSNDK